MALRSALWALAFTLASVAGSAIMWGFVVDDAFIPIRYARHLATGAGYRFNASGPSTDGVTPLPWAFLLYPLAHGTAVQVLGRVKVAGVLLQAVAAALVGARVGTLGERVAAKAAAAALWLVCLPLAAWGPSGMETPLATALCAACVFYMYSPRHAAVWAGLAAAIRPELLPWALVVGGGLAIAAKRPARVVATAALLAIVPFAVCTLARAIAFGRAGPLAVMAKPSDLAHGFVYAEAALLAAGLPLTLLAPLALRRASPQAKVLAAAFFVHVLAVIAAGGDWMPYARLLVPVLPSLLVVLVEVARVSPLWSFWTRTALAGALALDVFVMAGPAGRHVMKDRLELIGRARTLLAPSKKIAATDVGWVSAATEADIVDLAGLTDPDFAALPGGHTSKRADVSMLLDRGVDTIILYVKPLTSYDAADWPRASYAHRVGARLASDPLLESHYFGRATLPIGDTGSGYVVLARSAH